METLFDKINKSDYYLALGTRSFLEGLKYKEKYVNDIREQTRIARQLKKEFIILIDKSLSTDEKRELEDYFVGDNILGIIEFDKNDLESIGFAIRKLIDKKRDKWKYGS